MRPDEQNSGQGGNPLSDQRAVNNQNIANIEKTKQATIEVVRSQIDNIYNSSENTQNTIKPLSEKKPNEVKKHIAEDYVSPYKLNHTEHVKPKTNNKHPQNNPTHHHLHNTKKTPHLIIKKQQK